jgi:hypothetical protein
VSALVAFALVVAVGFTASPASATGVFHEILNQNSGLCLQPRGGSPAPEVAIEQTFCDGTTPQGWYAEPVTGTRYKLINQASGLCMNVFGPTANETPILMIECVRVSNEEFTTGTALPGLRRLESRAGNRNTGFCVDVPGGSRTAHVNVRLWVCNGTTAQAFFVGQDI